METETVKGFKDIEGEQSLKQEKIKEIISNNFKLYGFEPVETPIIEYEEFVKGENSQDEAVSDIFKLKDKGDRNLALRYEFTFQLKRLVNNKKLPYRRYQIGPVFRDEPISANRFRQFTQCDADIIGSNVKNEAEILSLAKITLEQLKIKSTIYVNNRKLLNEILDSEKIKDKQGVMREIDKIDKLSESEVRNNLKKYNAEKILLIFKKPEDYFKKYSAYKEILELKKYTSYFGVKIIFQPFLVRGLSYYNGAIFEIKTSEIKETICSGGSYMINNIQSTGISFGLERISYLSKVSLKEDNLLIISIDQDKTAINLSNTLRNNKVNCTLFFGKVLKALDYANSKKIKFVLFIGENEIKSKYYTLRDMNSGKETKISEKDLLSRFK